MVRKNRAKKNTRKHPSRNKRRAPQIKVAMPNTGSEAVPPGATTRAFERDTTPEEEELGSRTPYHAAADPDSPDESYEATDTNEPLADVPQEELDPLEKGPPYAGSSGGAVGGTPAQGRSSGGRTEHGIDPGGVHRGDSTIGANPERG